MPMDTIRRILRRAFERLNADAGLAGSRPVGVRPRDTGVPATRDEKTVLRQAGFADEALP